MKTHTDRILSIIKFLFWLVFIGLCIKTGAIILSFIISLFSHSEAAGDLYLGLNLAELYQNHFWYFICLVTLIIGLSAMKTYIAFLVTKIFTKINFDTPFNNITACLLTNISHMALGAGILALIANAYNMYLFKRSLIDLSAQSFVEGSREFLFLAGIIFIIAQIFKKGVDLQSENELTI